MSGCDCRFRFAVVPDWKATTEATSGYRPETQGNKPERLENTSVMLVSIWEMTATLAK